jgi:hypothetical protein
MPLDRLFGEGEIMPLPRPVAPAITARGFVVCPAPLQARLGDDLDRAQELYRLAFEQAQAELIPSWYERGRGVCAN